MYRLPDAPLPLSGILDDGFKLFRASWKQLLPVAIVASLLGAVPQLMISGLRQVRPAEIPGLPTIGAGAVLTFVVFVLLSVVSYAVVLAGTHQAARSETVSIGAALREGVSRSPALLGVMILVVLAVCIGMVLLFIPGLYLMIALYPAFLLPVVERLGPIASLTRSRALVKGAWWRTAGVLTVVGLILIALLLVISFLVGLAAIPFAVQGDIERATLGATFVTALVTAPLLPLGYCMMYAVYTDLRLRKDGGDLVSRAVAVGV